MTNGKRRRLARAALRGDGPSGSPSEGGNRRTRRNRQFRAARAAAQSTITEAQLTELVDATMAPDDPRRSDVEATDA